MDRIINDEVSFCPKIEKEVTKECVDLIKRMLTKDPKDRINMVEVVNHPWVKTDIHELFSFFFLNSIYSIL